MPTGRSRPFLRSSDHYRRPVEWSGWVVRALLLGTTALASGCGGEDGTTGPQSVLFEVAVHDERFTIRVEAPATVAALQTRMESGREGVINGRLAPGDGGFNEPWSWHMVPGTVEVADVAIELCDGRPSMIEEDLDYWLNTVGQYCPWGALVVRRLSLEP